LKNVKREEKKEEKREMEKKFISKNLSHKKKELRLQKVTAKISKKTYMQGSN